MKKKEKKFQSLSHPVSGFYCHKEPGQSSQVLDNFHQSIFMMGFFSSSPTHMPVIAGQRGTQESVCVWGGCHLERSCTVH